RHDRPRARPSRILVGPSALRALRDRERPVDRRPVRAGAIVVKQAADPVRRKPPRDHPPTNRRAATMTTGLERIADSSREPMGPQYLGSIDQSELLRRRRRRPTLISIFSGCGGAALGFAMAGWEVRVFVENDPACCQTLALNWKARRAVKRSQRRNWHQ